jgi:hypothetical protein
MIARNISSRRTRKSADPKVRPGTSRLQLRKSVKKGTKLKVIRRSSASAAKKGIRTFRSALEFLNSQVNYERRPPSSRAKMRGVYTLTRMKRLLVDLDNPQRAFRSVHIGGTKGKGSTATMLANMLQSNGLRVGLYTSPHVVDVRERIAIDGELIPEAAFVRQISTIADIVSRYKSIPDVLRNSYGGRLSLFPRERRSISLSSRSGWGDLTRQTSFARRFAASPISALTMIQLGERRADR